MNDSWVNVTYRLFDKQMALIKAGNSDMLWLIEELEEESSEREEEEDPYANDYGYDWYGYSEESDDMMDDPEYYDFVESIVLGRW